MTPTLVTRSMLVLALWSIAASAAAVEAGGRAPEIGLPDLGGHSITVAGLRGQVFVVDFWGTWCPPCAQELPFLQRLYESLHGDGFTVIAVASDRDRTTLESFVRRLHLTFPIVHDGGLTVPPRYRSTTQPSSYLVDRLGIVRYVHRGYTAREAPVIEQEVRALVAEPRP